LAKAGHMSLSLNIPTEIARAGYRLAAILKKIWP
jgi:hypothetical protein